MHQSQTEPVLSPGRDGPPTPADFVLQVEGDGYVGFVVVDSIVEGRSAGGLRIADDLPVEEVFALAQEMSHKYALFHLPRGGAKSGLRLDPGLDRQARERALLDFGRRLAPIFRAGIYSPGMDMNCGPDELRTIYRGAGFELGGVTDTSWYTAMTVLESLLATTSHLGIEDRPTTLAIEGFGGVARHLASRLDPRRFRIVALSTIEGGLHTAGAIDPSELVAAKERHGDGLVRELGGEPLDRQEVLAVEADVVLPSSRTWVVTTELAARMRARAVVPISNAPYAGGAVQSLHARGVVVLPGFVSNVGGVLASSLHDLGLADGEIEGLLASDYRPIVDGILRLASQTKRPATEIAEELARQHAQERPAFRRRSLAQRLHERLVRPRLPRGWRARQARQDFLDRSQRTLREIRDRERRG